MAIEEQGVSNKQPGSPLYSERGTTRIEDQVVAKIAGIAAQEVDGVKMGTGTSRTLGGIVDTVTGGGGERRGVSVEVGQIEAAVDLVLEIQYGKSIPTVADSVRSNVIRQIENLVGLKVTEVNIVVSDIYFEGDVPQPSAEDEKVPIRGQERVQ